VAAALGKIIDLFYQKLALVESFWNTATAKTPEMEVLFSF
jgi:hypothetical protein